MAHRLVWSPEALEDIEQIASYIAQDSPQYAKVVARKLVKNAEFSASQPFIGRIVPEIGNKNIRERFVYSYRVIYQVFPERIRVVAVIHGSRLLLGLFHVLLLKKIFCDELLVFYQLLDQVSFYA